MNSHHANPIYTDHIHRMLCHAPRSVRTFTLALLLVAFAVLRSRATDWTPLEQQLARKIAAATGPGAVAFDLRNQSSLSKKDADEITRGLRAQLNAAGLRFVAPEQAAATVSVTLSENLQSYLWIAVTRQGTNESAVLMVSVPRNSAVPFARDSSQLLLRKTLLWSQDERILDVASFEEMSGLSHLAVLSPGTVTLYRFQEGRWQVDQAMPIVHSRPWPRDLRGRLVLRQDHLFDVYLPGVFCQSSAAAPLTLTCRASDDPWPLSTDPALNAFYAGTRNFFTGVLTPGVGKQTSTSKFYSAAPIPRASYTLWIFAAADGSQHILDGVSDQVSRFDWGSDLAAISSSCGGGWQVLTTSRGDGPLDSVRAYEFPDRDPIAVTPPLEFSGTINALWTEPKGKSVLAIARSAETGSYEAYRLTVTCAQ
jgi:hypothetical protein